MSLPTTFFIGRGGGPLTAAQIAAAALSGDTTVFQDDDNLATISNDESAMEQIMPNATAYTAFLNNMLVQVYVATGNEFYGSGTSSIPVVLQYSGTITDNLNNANNFSGGNPVRGFKVNRQNNTAPDAGVYVFKNFMPQGNIFTYYHEGYNGWGNGNTPHFCGFSTSTLSGGILGNRAGILANATAYSANGNSGLQYQGYYYSSGFSNGTNQSTNKGYTFAVVCPNPSTFPYVYIGLGADDGSTAGRSHYSNISPLYAARNNF